MNNIQAEEKKFAPRQVSKQEMERLGWERYELLRKPSTRKRASR